MIVVRRRTGWLWVETQRTSGDVCLLVLVPMPVPAPAPVAPQTRFGPDAWVMVACVMLVFWIDFLGLTMPRHGTPRIGGRGTRHERDTMPQRTCVLDATGRYVPGRRLSQPGDNACQRRMMGKSGLSLISEVGCFLSIPGGRTSPATPHLEGEVRGGPRRCGNQRVYTACATYSS